MIYRAIRALRWIVAAVLSVAAASAQPLPPPGPPSDLALPGPNVPGRFYGPIVIGAPASFAVNAANKFLALPVYIRAGSVLKTLSFNIIAGNAAAWNARVCLYADSGQGLPGTLVTDPGTIAVGSGSLTGVQTATIPGGGIALSGGWYWEAFLADNNAESVASVTNPAGGSFYSSRLMGASSVANLSTGNNPTVGVVAAQTFGACPATFPAPTFGDALPIPFIVMGY